MTSRYFEDFRPGETWAFGDYPMREEEMIAFARDYDPQLVHLDAQAGARSMLGGLAASGWHSCAALMRLNVENWLGETSRLAGVGVEDNRWLAPVRAGDRLSAQVETLEKIDLRSRPDAGIVKMLTILRNQEGTEVMRQTGLMMFGRRAPRDPAETDVPARKPQDAPAPERIDDPEGALPDHYGRAVVGAWADLGATQFSADFIRDFATAYDPQPFHVDEEAGRRSLLGGLSASGWQTAACWMRHCIAFRRKASGGGEAPSRISPGFTNLVWRKPVLAGDTIAYSTQIIAKRATSKPNLGLIRNRNLGVNQRGETVLAFEASSFTPIEE